MVQNLVVILISAIIFRIVFRLGYKEGKDSVAEELTNSWEEGYSLGVENTKEFYKIDKRS